MAVRFNVRSRSRFGVPSLPSGYEANGASTNFTIPSVGIEDVDVALFNLFNNEISFQVFDGNANGKKVPIVFATGEKWAMVKRNKALQDNNGSLILPVITVGRTNFKQNVSSDITGRGINQQQGDLVVRRRLTSADREFQRLVNRLGITNQSNLFISDISAQPGERATKRRVGDLTLDPTVQDGGLLMPDLKLNMHETIVVPAPQFNTLTYEVIMWSLYSQQMNQMLEQLVSSYLPQGNAWRLDTPKGYWFVATVDGDSHEQDSNFTEMSGNERIIKQKFTISVQAYILASKVPGAPVPVRRYVSFPTVEFGTTVGDVESATGKDTIDDPFLGADDPTLPMTIERTLKNRRDLRDDSSTRLYPSGDELSADDTARSRLPRGRQPSKYKKLLVKGTDGVVRERFVRISTINVHAGETTFADPIDLGALTIDVGQ